MEKYLNGLRQTNNEYAFEKCFLVTNNFYEPKEKKFEFTDKVSSAIDSIKNDVNLYYYQQEMMRHSNSLNNTKDKIKNNLPYKKLQQNNAFLLTKKQNSQVLTPIESKINSRINCDRTNYKKIKSIQRNRNEIKIIDNITTDNNSNNSSLLKSNIIKRKSYDNIVEENHKQMEIENIKNNNENYYLNADISSKKKIRLPSIKSRSIKKDNTNVYIKRSINSIQEITQDLQKDLEQKEQDKYLAFKKKYNHLVIKSKKYELNLDQFLGNPNNKLPFPMRNRDPKNKNIVAVKKIIKKIFHKVKTRDNGNIKMKEIIDEVNNFHTHESMFRSRLQKGHEIFDYLVDDSKMIQSRINQKNIQLNISK